MAVIPLSPFLLKLTQLDKLSGLPAAGYKIFCYEAGSTTPTTFFTDSTGATPADNPYVLNSDGMADDTLYYPPAIGVKVIYTTELGPVSPTPIPVSGVTISTDDNLSNPGAVAFNNLGLLITEVSQLGMTASQQIAAGVTYATISGAGTPCTIYLPSAAETTFPLVIVNVAGNDAQVVRDGTDIFLGGDQLVDLPQGTSPMYTGCMLVSDGISTWRFLSYWTS